MKLNYNDERYTSEYYDNLELRILKIRMREFQQDIDELSCRIHHNALCLKAIQESFDKKTNLMNFNELIKTLQKEKFNQ